jgi:hypothetical protein
MGETWYDRASGAVFGLCAHGSLWYLRVGARGSILTACQSYGASVQCAPFPTGARSYRLLRDQYPNAIKLV